MTKSGEKAQKILEVILMKKFDQYVNASGLPKVGTIAQAAKKLSTTEDEFAARHKLRHA